MSFKNIFIALTLLSSITVLAEPALEQNNTVEMTKEVAETQKAELKVFYLLGNKVATIFNGIADGGKIYESVFNAKNYSSGIYFYQIQAGEFTQVRKMMLLK